jgi:hypothetical protein
VQHTERKNKGKNGHSKNKNLTFRFVTSYRHRITRLSAFAGNYGKIKSQIRVYTKILFFFRRNQKSDEIVG